MNYCLVHDVKLALTNTWSSQWFATEVVGRDGGCTGGGHGAALRDGHHYRVVPWFTALQRRNVRTNGRLSWLSVTQSVCRGHYLSVMCLMLAERSRRTGPGSMVGSPVAEVVVVHVDEILLSRPGGRLRLRRWNEEADNYLIYLINNSYLHWNLKLKFTVFKMFSNFLAFYGQWSVYPPIHHLSFIYPSI